jgi:MtN3 and saliva related transmembrane protein
MTELIGWTSSAILLVTLLVQVRAQWRARRTEAVSPWLFVGQLAANLGFIVYSALLGNAVFVVTNAVLACVSVAGWIVLVVHRRRERALAPTRAPVRQPAHANHSDSRRDPPLRLHQPDSLRG